MSSKQALYCSGCGTNNVDPLKIKNSLLCPLCGQRFSNSLVHINQGSFQTPKLLKLIGLFLSVSIVSAIVIFLFLEQENSLALNRDTDGQHDEQIFRSGKMSDRLSDRKR